MVPCLDQIAGERCRWKERLAHGGKNYDMTTGLNPLSIQIAPDGVRRPTWGWASLPIDSQGLCQP
jgi:hypothetical protein